jgi:DNA-binding protein HU-beta
MTKQDVIKRVSTRTRLDPAISRTVIESFFEVVQESLSEGEPIYIRQFGSFNIKHRAGKVARDITRNTTILVAPHVIPAFKPSPEFVRQVREREDVMAE